MSVRNLHPFDYWLSKLTDIDRLLIKNYEHCEAHMLARKFFLDHPEYTHFLFIAEDIILTKDMLQLLIQDLEENDFPVLCGYCNWDWRHDWVNITLKDLRKVQVSYAEQYDFVNVYNMVGGKMEYPFQKVFFQGLAVTFIKRNIMEQITFKPYKFISDKLLGKFEKRGIMHDLQMAIEYANLSIPVVCDTRCFCVHGGLTTQFIPNPLPEKTVTFYGRDGSVKIL
jgi:hypothetical protein